MKTVTVPTEWAGNPAYDAQFIGAFNGAGLPLVIDKDDQKQDRQLDHNNLRTVDPGELTSQKLGSITVYTLTEAPVYFIAEADGKFVLSKSGDVVATLDTYEDAQAAETALKAEAK
jgi:hypothetical protein